MSKYNIRNTVEEDFLDISEISSFCPPMINERNSIYHIFTKFFKSTSLVIENKDKKIIGFLLGFISPDNPQEGYLHQLCIVPPWRKKGLAQNLVEEFLNIIRKRGCKRVHLIINPGNKKALNFYKKLEFQINNKGKVIIVNGFKTSKNYDGPGEHKLICTKILD